MCCCCTPCGCASVAISPRPAPSRLRQRCWAPNAQDCALALSDGALFLVDGALFLVSARSKLTTLTFGWAWRSSSAQQATRVRRAMGERAGSLTATSASRLLPIPSAHSVGTSTGALPLVCPPSALHSALVLPSPRTDTLCARASVTGGAFLVVQLAVHLQGQTPPPARAPSIEPLPPQAGCTPIRSDCALTVCLSLHCALWARPVVSRVVFNGRESLLSRSPASRPSQWLQQQDGNAFCPICKAEISIDRIIPIYGRGRPEVDPR